MQITVKLFASFRAGRFNESKREYASNTNVNDVLCELKIPLSEVGMIMVNGRHAEPEYQLQDGVRLSLFPLLGGG